MAKIYRALCGRASSLTFGGVQIIRKGYFMKYNVAFILGLILNSGAFGFETLRFQANFLTIIQRGGGNAQSAQIAWVPEVPLAPDLTLRGELGVAPLKNAFGDVFLISNYELFLQWGFLEAFQAELGAGLSVWHGNGGGHPIASLYFAWDAFTQSIVPFLAYSHFFLRDRPAEEFKIGVRVKL